MLDTKPDAVIIRGDTNSTLVGALVASKLHIPLIHIEAGERSYNKGMPEEINRLVADRLADVLFCVTQTAVRHLAEEGIVRGVHFSGDVMLDALQQNLPVAQRESTILARVGLHPGYYLLATVHRAYNTDDPDNLRGIVAAFNAIREPIVFPVHPRTRSAIERLGLTFAPHVLAIEPVGYLDMLMLESNARAILTDSGGVQREAYFLSVPCITLRTETELIETVQTGWNTLVGTQTDRIMATVRDFLPPVEHPPLFGDGHAAERIVENLETSGLNSAKTTIVFPFWNRSRFQRSRVNRFVLCTISHLPEGSASGRFCISFGSEIMRVGIVGGGILGITLGYYLSKQKANVTIYEASDTLGGLAGPIKMDGYNLDRFYHAILTSDAHLQDLFAELGISDRYRAKETKAAFYNQGRLYAMNNMKDFMTFPLLSLFDRFRLGLTIVYAQRERNLNKVEAVDVRIVADPHQRPQDV